MSSGEMSKGILRRTYERMNAGDLDAVGELFPPVMRLNGQDITFAQWKQIRESFLHAFPDMHVTLEEVIADGDWIADRHTIRATHLGEFQGIAPTGRQITFTGLELGRVVDGRLVEAWDIADMTSLMRQLTATES